MYRFLLTRRWLGLFVLVVVLIPVMIRLGFWQYDRYEGKHDRNAAMSSNLKHTPTPAGELLAVGRDVPAKDRWRRVTATGSYDLTHQMLVRQRSLDGKLGYFVVTPLVTADGTALLVNRGWVESGDNAGKAPEVPAPPPGQVTATGRVRPAETASRSGIKDRDVPDGQIMRIDTPKLAKVLPYPVYGGFAELVDQQPQTEKAPKLLPGPEDEDLGLNLAYAVQWWLFVAGLIGAFIVMIRREAAELRAIEAELEESEETEDKLTPVE